ncbi:MAG: hypothetical protein CMO80_17370 [Verrucomicrobiales bacterium]|nr:hypothetical protein [Verrucomicrobiales bacterium]|tara:strand:+ start:2291 stop:2533 length:243 start_codon:yes stop_codon:yes gene_type:complete
MKRLIPTLAAFVALTLSPLSFAQDVDAEPDPGDGFSDEGFNLENITSLSLEQLMDVEVEIATKKAEPISAIPAAVSVITN